MPHLDRPSRWLYPAMLAAFLVFGITLTIVGATLPEIIREFRWSYTAAGVLLASGSVGYFVTTFVSGLLVQHLGPKRVIVAGLALQGVGLMLFGVWPAFAANLAFYVLLGVGHGCTEVVGNVCVVRIERGGRSRLMNLMHAAFAAGAIVGPAALAGLLAAGFGWRSIYRVMGVVSGAMGLSLAALSFAGADGRADRHPRRRLLQLLKDPLLVLCFLVLLLYVGAEVGISQWLAEYFRTILRAGPRTAALMVSVFWVGLLAGRAGLSWAYRGRRPEKVLVALACTCTAAVGFAVAVERVWLAGLCFGLAGLGYSAIYPLVMALVGMHFRGAQSVAMGFASTGGGIGAFSLPLAMAAVSDATSLRAGFAFYLALSAMMTGVTVLILRLVRARARAGAAANGQVS